MRKRANFVLVRVAVLACCGCLSTLNLAGCGSSASGAGDEYRAFSETKVRDSEGDLPVITPGEPGHSEVQDDPVTGGAATADAASESHDSGTADGNGGKVIPAAHEGVATQLGAEDDTQAAVGEPSPEGPPTLTETGTRSEVILTAREPKLLVPQNSFMKDRDTGALRVTYDDIDLLRVLNMEPVPTDAAEHFPDWLRKLNGKQIRIRGFMYPAYKATGLTSFGLARDNGICCFVRQAKIYDLFPVRMAEGQETDYIQNRPFDVVGTFHIDPVVEDDELFRLYRIDNARVIDK